MANRDQPINGHGSRLSLRSDGSLLLFDFDGSQVWRANTTLAAGAAKLELLSSGNLVLTDSTGAVIWESFDYPTDTLLPSQPITKGKFLVSASRSGSVSSGYYSLFYDNDNVLSLKFDSPEISSVYWPNPDYNVWQNGRTVYNSSRLGLLGGEGRFLSSDRLEFSASDVGHGVKRRLTLDHDGNLRLYSLINGSSWSVTWEAIAQPCRIHGLCGRNGICVYTTVPKCSCPPGYEMRDPSDWFKGCRPQFNRSCGAEEVTFVEIAHTDFYGYDLNYSQMITMQTCRESCEQDCSCEGFGYRLNGEGECFPKIALFNGYQSPDFFGNMYLKVPKNLIGVSSDGLKGLDPVCGSNKEEDLGFPNMFKISKGNSYTYLYWFVSAIGGIEALFILSGWYYLYRDRGLHNSVEQGYMAISKQFKRFTYGELKKATNKFKVELGRGGSGVVYKGVLNDARVVAVKKLADMNQGEEEFWAEVSTIGTIYHMNLVRMWGYCSEAAHRLLVYEYIDNGSLAKHLFSSANSSKLLGWEQRYRIAVGTAKGLAYLHHECLEWVIHCDVKPENILLDSDFEAKIADFGLAKLSHRSGFQSHVSRIRGTKGYLAPEWASNLPITAKIDVYSYGIVLLEIVKGSRISNWVLEGEEQEEVELRKIVSFARSMIESADGSWIDELVDQRLIGRYDKRQAVMMISLALSCVEEDRNKRPTMGVIVQDLLAVEEEPASTVY